MHNIHIIFHGFLVLFTFCLPLLVFRYKLILVLPGIKVLVPESVLESDESKSVEMILEYT